jgi:catechol 2,3-dioxygenase-like lactoylglutathione lyase family enzyme
MIGYVTIGAKDSEASGKFYDAVFGAIGAERKSAEGGWIFYGPKGSDGVVALCPPFNKQPATAGNGSMVAFKAKSIAEVDAAHQAGLGHGGNDEGAPGFRPPQSTSGFYGAYMRDPTGNKICVFCRA